MRAREREKERDQGREQGGGRDRDRENIPHANVYQAPQRILIFLALFPQVMVGSFQPEMGRCIVFRQPPVQEYFHDGQQLKGGIKYLFRTDVMYRVVQPGS